MKTFAQFESRTIIQATLEIETALSVGSRVSLEPTGTDLPVIKTVEGIPLIPGSSIKGVVRTQTERILRSVYCKPAFWACDPFANPCVSEEKKEAFLQEIDQEIKEKKEPALTRKIWEASCTVCRLFGSPQFGSRLFFKDAFLLNDLNEMPVITQIRDGVGIDRDLGVTYTRAKYDFEVVVPGTRFGIEILSENLDEWELGFLLSVLQLWQKGHFSIGGKSTRGPGWGKLQNLIVWRVEKHGLLDYLLNGQMNEVNVQEILRAFHQELKNRGVKNA
jgi:CRISPR-associated RAMP protein (TIGR02581 family)